MAGIAAKSTPVLFTLVIANRDLPVSPKLATENFQHSFHFYGVLSILLQLVNNSHAKIKMKPLVDMFPLLAKF